MVINRHDFQSRLRFKLTGKAAICRYLRPGPWRFIETVHVGAKRWTISCEGDGMAYPYVILSMLVLMPLVALAKDENVLTIESWGNGAPELRISVPLGYAVEKHKGPDFDVHYVGSKNPGDPSMGIYVGHHPNPFSSQKKGVESEKEVDTILGQKVEWILWQEKGDGEITYHCEVIVKEAFKGMRCSGMVGLMIHVFIKGPDQKQVNLLKTSARSLRIVNQ